MTVAMEPLRGEVRNRRTSHASLPMMNSNDRSDHPLDEAQRLLWDSDVGQSKGATRGLDTRLQSLRERLPHEILYHDVHCSMLSSAVV